MADHMTCRFCNTKLVHSFTDLGMSPPSNSFLKFGELTQMEPFFPLHAFVCSECKLVQLPQFHTPDSIFSKYVYFSSFSDSWLDHAKRYVQMMVPRFQLSEKSYVIELGSNDGYLLRYFREQGVPVLGIEPAQNIAEVARQAGIPTINRFFGEPLAKELHTQGKSADLLLLNNVLAQIPDLHDFIRGMKLLLKPKGIFTIEFPHLLKLMEENQFDTIYHEHFSYFSFLTTQKIFAYHGFTLFDVEQVPTHGGSLRIFGRHSDQPGPVPTTQVDRLLDMERRAGLDQLEAYSAFEAGVKRTKRELLSLLIDLKSSGKKIIGYGAPAKGNTLLNYCGIRNDFLQYTVDRSSHKQGLYLPGTHIPVEHPNRIRETRPDYVLILPWNLKEEIVDQMSFIREWGGKFIVPIPKAEVI